MRILAKHKRSERAFYNTSQRALVAARMANMPHGGNRKNQDANLQLENLVSQSEAAEMLNVSTVIPVS